jgi:curved DNA-binding protein CbpA
MNDADDERDWLRAIAPKCDYFTLLGVSRQVVDPNELRSAARIQADRLGPLRRGDDAEQVDLVLKRIGRAYRTLADPARRAEYLAKARAKKKQASAASSSNEAIFDDATLKPPAASTVSLFENELSDDDPSGIDFDKIARAPSRAQKQPRRAWVPIASILFVLLNLGIVGYWWKFVRVDPNQALRQARQEAIDQRKREGQAHLPAGKIDAGANLPPAGPDPNLQPDAFQSTP